MAAETIAFIYIAPIVIGLAIGLVELFFVHADEAGMGWMGHGLHAIPTCILFTFISMNAHWVLQFVPWAFAKQPWAVYGVPILIGIIAAIKVKAAAAIAKGGTVGEKMSHALIIGALIALAPFVWPFIGPALPAVLQR
ncbi:MAG TPA: hypothetical protein VK158_01975 [Acidobacteriota bacterium]|nr:hypothetical protein [Acidobacteriota bacterium]